MFFENKQGDKMSENQTHKDPVLDKEAEIEREWNEYVNNNFIFQKMDTTTSTRICTNKK